MQPSVPALVWGLPFAGLLATMALLPAVAARFWHRRMGFIALFWAATLLLPQAIIFGPHAAGATIWHAMVIDYLPFVTLLLSLYVAGGGVLLRGGPAGSPVGNTAMLALGMVMGLVMGTTGASMVLIHPLLRANAHRRRKVHLVLFLIVLVANASGALTPLGNPPLYLGLLHGVPFFWPAQHLGLPLLAVSTALLTVFYLIDWHFAADEMPAPKREPFRVRGWRNVALILLIICAVLAQNLLPSAVLAALFVAVTLISVAVTPRAVRQANDFTWEPILEVAKLFAAIFITVVPVVAMLHAGLAGPLAFLLRATQRADGSPWPLAYFWMTGLLSAVLDNAPTYLVFFEMSGIHPASLAAPQAKILAAISAGAVFFGGLTYIGNAPNMMLRAIAAHRGVRMPGFFGFTLLASTLMVPILGLIGAIFFN